VPLPGQKQEREAWVEEAVAVFVDGCFWHGCPKHATKPANNRAFWKKKLAGNKTRDRLVNRTLRRAGWRVVRIWPRKRLRLTRWENIACPP
jgi:DNA mismatch endonuclease (patch repair protein)